MKQTLFSTLAAGILWVLLPLTTVWNGGGFSVGADGAAEQAGGVKAWAGLPQNDTGSSRAGAFWPGSCGRVPDDGNVLTADAPPDVGNASADWDASGLGTSPAGGKDSGIGPTLAGGDASGVENAPAGGDASALGKALTAGALSAGGAAQRLAAAGDADRRGGFDREFALPVLREGEVVSMTLGDYLTGVLLAEMPMDFQEEALKAQAVACRTYTLRSYDHRRHGAAAVCTDSGCCQGWRDPETADPADRARAESAVAATDGMAIYHEGSLIDATFFSCSGGQTEAAAAVWGSDLPYLQAVPSPGEEEAAHYADETRIPLEDFRAGLESLDGAVDFPEALGAWVGEITYTPGGGVDTIILAGRPFRGTQLRKQFGLRSTAFTLTLTAEAAIFSTRGYGHRVGMSQYGANAMAKRGSDFREILLWYYRGVEIRAAD